ncbi:MAG: transposase [Verrucomicrobia bacterium]|nr:transposase [Verrucomicrobiota bacterium]
MYKQFDQEFRDNAICLALEKKVKLNDLAKDLGIGRSTLNKWMSQHRKGHPISSGLTPEQKEIKRLQRENEILKEERDILKKAMAIFSSPQKRGSLL